MFRGLHQRFSATILLPCMRTTVGLRITVWRQFNVKLFPLRGCKGNGLCFWLRGHVLFPFQKWGSQKALLDLSLSLWFFCSLSLPLSVFPSLSLGQSSPAEAARLSKSSRTREWQLATHCWGLLQLLLVHLRVDDYESGAKLHLSSAKNPDNTK